MTLTILCSGALAPDASPGSPAPLPPPPADSPLWRALRRARAIEDARQDALVPRELPDEAWLRRAFGVPEADSIEAFALLREPTQDRAAMVRPVHLHVGIDHLVLVPPSGLGIEAGEAAALAAAASDWLAEEGVRFEPVAPDAWRMHAPDEAGGHRFDGLLARSTRMAAGRNIDAYQPEGGNARRWRKLSNELQMLWFEHPVNAQRERRGLPALNSLWLEGFAGPLAAKPFERVVAAERSLLGLAIACGARAEAADVLPSPRALASHDAPTLVDAGAWRAASMEQDPGAWLDAWARFERWFLELLGSGAASRTVRLVLTGERRSLTLELEPGGRWRFWRRFDARSLLFPR